MTTLEIAIGLRTEKKYVDALNVLHDLLNASPDDPLLHYQCAWTCDNAGKEKEAAPHSEAALRKGLAGDDRRSAFLGLGSTYRCPGQCEKSLSAFNLALSEFPG